MTRAMYCRSVLIGHCILILEDKVIYDGPIKLSPNVLDPRALLLLHEFDYRQLQARLTKEQKPH